MSMLKNWMERQPTGVSNMARKTLLSGSVGGQTRLSRVRMSKLQGFGQKPEDRSETAVPSNWPTDASSSAADRPRLRTDNARLIQKFHTFGMGFYRSSLIFMEEHWQRSCLELSTKERELFDECRRICRFGHRSLQLAGRGTAGRSKMGCKGRRRRDLRNRECADFRTTGNHCN